MYILEKLDELFTNHTSLTVAFSGFGIIIISYFASKIIRHLKSQKRPQLCTENDYVSENTSSVVNQIQTDIDTLRASINHVYTFQEGTFVRYFNKYKNKLDPSDVLSLNEQYENIKKSSLPNYAIIINKLIGLLEAIREQ